MKQNTKPRRPWGFSFMEVLVVVAVIGILGSIAVVMVSDVFRSSSGAKLTSDVRTLNSAVLSYLASNGDLSSAKSASDVIAKLKSVADQSSAGAINGYRGGFLDGRVEPVMQTEEEATTQSLRVYWDAATMKFTIATSGAAGIKGFRFNDDLALGDPKTEVRGELLALAKEGAWIWDYTEAPPTYAAGPSVIPVSEISSPPVDPIPVSAPPAHPPGPSGTFVLAAPQLSIPSGTYPITDFDLRVILINPNPTGTSQLFYRIGFGSWIPYSGSPRLFRRRPRSRPRLSPSMPVSTARVPSRRGTISPVPSPSIPLSSFRTIPASGSSPSTMSPSPCRT